MNYTLGDNMNNQVKMRNSYQYLQARKYTMPQIVEMLAGLGFRNQNGIPFNAAQIKSEVSKINLTIPSK